MVVFSPLIRSTFISLGLTFTDVGMKNLASYMVACLVYPKKNSLKHLDPRIQKS
jgi:hypothetical protein